MSYTKCTLCVDKLRLLSTVKPLESFITNISLVVLTFNEYPNAFDGKRQLTFLQMSTNGVAML